jgi:hypothetical protein
MKNMKMGFIVQILRQDNLGVVREEGTLTEWLFYLNDAPEKLRIDDAVMFERDQDAEQFVAVNVSRINSIRARRAV